MSSSVERQIDLKKYFVHLVRYWWMMVLLAALCGAAVGTLKYIKDKKANEQQETESIQNVQSKDEVVDVEKRIEEVKAGLDAVERQNVDLAVEYYRIMQQYNRYKDASVYLSQNPYKVNKTTLYYKVELDASVNGSFDEQQVLIGDIVQAYVSYINTGDFSTGVSENINLDSQYVIELVSADKNSDGSSVQNYFRVSIINDSEMESMGNEIKECIANYGTQIADTLPKHSVKLIDEYDAVVVDDNLVDDIQGIRTDIYNASTRLAALKKAFSDEQLMCYNNAIGVVDVIESEDNEEVVEFPSETITEAHIQIKYVVVGMILGVVIYCCIILARFLFTSCVLAESGFQSMFNLRYLGKLVDNKDEDILGMIAMKICLACKKDSVSKVAMISSDFSNISEEDTETLVDRLQKENIEVVKLDRTLMDGKSMSELFDIGKCILVEQTGKTKIAKLANLIDLCSDNSIDVYGVVDIQG